MDWLTACLVFDENIFSDYNLFCIFFNSISDTVSCSESTSIINQFALWIDNRAEFPDIENTALADALQSRYESLYKYKYISEIRGSLEVFKQYFDNADKPKYWTDTEQDCLLTVEKPSNMFDSLRNLGEGLADAQRFCK